MNTTQGDALFQEDFAAFIESPVMQIIGSANASRRPEIARGAGAWASVDRKSLSMVVSAWQWPQTIANFRDNSKAAATFTRPSDYVSYQVKGTAEVRPALPDEAERSARYMVDIVSTQMKLGLLPELIMPVLGNRDPMLITLHVTTIFEQTPGARAGTRIWSAA